MLLSAVALAAVVAANPAQAAEGNGWSCISPFANYTNSAYPDDQPAKDSILDSLAISVTRTDTTPLSATAGQRLTLNDLQLGLEFTDARVAEQMYRRTGGATASYSQLIPYTQTTNDTRTLSVRANPADGGASWWSYGSSTAPTFVQKIEFPGEPPKVRAATTAPNTTWYYATPTLGLGHRYISHTGNSQFPLDAWVTVAASNTVEGVQTLPVKGYWTVNIKDATPGTPGNPSLYANDAVTATIPPVSLGLPSSRWTPTGAGPVEFTIAQPGQLGIVQIESKGYDRVGYNTPLNVRPFGSVYVRAQTESYGATNDCIPGQVTLANTGVSASGMFFGDADPTTPDPALGDPATPGHYATQSGQGNAVGVRGRFGFAFTALPAIATAPLAVASPAPLPVPAPAPTKPVTFGAASSLTATKGGTVKLALTNPNSAAVRFKVSAKTVSRYKVGKAKKVVTVAAAKTVSLTPGASNVSVSLSKAAKALLQQRKSLKVKLTLTPVGGGETITKTITLKRS